MSYMAIMHYNRKLHSLLDSCVAPIQPRLQPFEDTRLHEYNAFRYAFPRMGHRNWFRWVDDLKLVGGRLGFIGGSLEAAESFAASFCDFQWERFHCVVLNISCFFPLLAT